MILEDELRAGSRVMGYVLEFYSADWAVIGRVLGSEDQRLYAAILANRDARLDGGERATADEAADWASALRELILGQRGRELASRQAQSPRILEELPLPMAVALVSILRARGRPLGAMRHRSRGGVYFREVFLAEEAPSAFRSQVDFTLLIERPLFGVTHSAFPSWGGLTKAELSSIVGGRTVDDLPALDDPASATWLLELWDVLSAADARHEDLVTVYY